MMVVLGGAFALLLAILALFESLEYDTAIETAESEFTTTRLGRVLPILESINSAEIENYLGRISHCHDGYEASASAYGNVRISDRTEAIARHISQTLSIEAGAVQVGFATFTPDDFSYAQCEPSEMSFPLEGLVVSVEFAPEQWLHAEIHPHEWHLTPTMSDWLFRSGTAFLLIGGIAVLFVRRLSKPFVSLTDAATKFADGLEITELDETGPSDIKKAIRSFNMMQRQVTDEVQRRTNTLAAISHDIRSPLTALRVKAELIDDDDIRADQIASIEKMERITASALDFLKGESRSEGMRKVDLGVLVESECEDFREMGAEIDFVCERKIHFACRPDALARAIRNLIENAIKYAGPASVRVEDTFDAVQISVTDNGPGIPENKMTEVLRPFSRLSDARESDKGGFGLGLAIAQAVVEGHDGRLILHANLPSGLIASIRLPHP